MLSEGFGKEYNWIPHHSVDGDHPVADGVLVDVKLKDESVYCGVACNDPDDEAGKWFWITEGSSRDIVAWRLHVPSKLPQPARPAPPMPAINPAKGSYENVECSSTQTSPPVFVPEGEGYHKGLHDHTEQSRVVQAFNRMTGNNITDDNLKTLKILMELLGSGNGAN